MLMGACQSKQSKQAAPVKKSAGELLKESMKMGRNY